jgi:23S rRNA (adenine2503-C2)-methyltransferase
MQKTSKTKINLLNLSKTELNDFIKNSGLEPYRADQIFKGIYVHLLPDFSPLSTITKKIRNQLNEITALRSFTLIRKNRSLADGSTKFLWQLSDGLCIESVIIYEKQRVTLCISSQVGCPLKCKFCATAKMGFFRNLSCGEIVEQVILMKEYSERKPTNIVFMGMGEPLLNMKNVLKAAYILSDPEGMAFARKKITISTSGIIEEIMSLADLNIPFPLAVSLNAVSDHKRQKLMPVAKKYKLADLFHTIQYYHKKTKIRITFEYLLISGVNDSKTDADLLIKFTRNIPCKINLIPYNSTNHNFTAPSDDKIILFTKYLQDHGRTAIIRVKKGDDIQAACGQLYYQNIRKKLRGNISEKIC